MVALWPTQVVTNNSLAAARQFSLPRLAVWPTSQTSLRHAPKQKDSTQVLSFCFGAPTWARTRDLLLKRELLYRLSYGRISLRRLSLFHLFG